ncbi:MAG TPA: NrfD/PsrC family molybdoenzyme membrane anchor subunit [Beutenbergiaceae bacterium]|nr:NrfD/PsrC family molybdoenzyme membrane anchor subunit [Beutenbergiaceae bacterium]
MSAAEHQTSEEEFTSYYGLPVVKESPWEVDIPIYIFAGGLASVSSLLAAGGQLTARPALQRAGRLAAAGGLSVSLVALIHDLGRPARFLNMLRTVRLTSPMSVGTWLLSLYGAPAGLAALDEIVRMTPLDQKSRPARLLRSAGRPAGLVAALAAPPVATYTAVLLSDTSTPSWHSAYRELPFVFSASAATAAGGLAMLAVPVNQAAPARRMAVAGSAVELVAEQVMERSMGIAAEPLHQGKAGRYMRAAKILTATGAAGALLGGRRRWVAALSGAALLAGSFCTRMGVFEAGQASARDPKYTVVPQRERLNRGEPVRFTPRDEGHR